MQAIDFFEEIEASRAASFLKKEGMLWEAIPKIASYIESIISNLPQDYKEIAPQVWIGPDTYIERTALLQGPCIIGANCQIRHNAFVRPQVLCGDGVVIGNATEVKNAILFDGVQIPHFNYVGDSILGYKAHLGAGAILSNYKSTGDEIHIHIQGEKVGSGTNKFGALLADRVEVGCNSVLFPGTIVGKDSIIYPLSSVRGTIAPKTILKSDGLQYPKK